MQAVTGAGGEGWFACDPRSDAELPPVPPECGRLVADYPLWRPWMAEGDGLGVYRARLTSDPARPPWEVAGRDVEHLARLVSLYEGVLAPWRFGRGTRPAGPGGGSAKRRRCST
jgi:hypothetical protein